MNEQLKAKVAASNQAQANAEYAGIACQDWHVSVIEKKTWIKIGKNEDFWGRGDKKFDPLGKLADQSRYYQDESYWKIL